MATDSDLVGSTPNVFTSPSSLQAVEMPASPLATALRDSAAKLSEKREL